MKNLIKALPICDIDPADVSEADKAELDDYYKETDFETYRVLTFEEGYYIVKDYEEGKTAVR